MNKVVHRVWVRKNSELVDNKSCHRRRATAWMQSMGANVRTLENGRGYIALTMKRRKLSSIMCKLNVIKCSFTWQLEWIDYMTTLNKLRYTIGARKIEKLKKNARPQGSRVCATFSLYLPMRRVGVLRLSKSLHYSLSNSLLTVFGPSSVGLMWMLILLVMKQFIRLK